MAHLVVGLTPLDAPFKGGVLVPEPDLLVFGLPLDATGSLLVSGAFPPDLPAGIDLYVQMWIEDGGAVHGLSASNALLATTK